MARIDNLEFLSDVVPRTTTFKQYKQKKSKKASQQAGQEAAYTPGQTTLDGRIGGRADRNGMSHHEPVALVSDDDDEEEDGDGLQIRTKEAAGSGISIDDEQPDAAQVTDEAEMNGVSDTEPDVEMEDRNLDICLE